MSTCSGCSGKGTARCVHCGGTGTFHLPAKTLGEWQTLPIPQPCRHCEGDGKIDCPRCQGTGIAAVDDCEKHPTDEFLQAVEQFNREEFYECHETLEDLWRAETGKIRDFYKGMLQIGVGIYHARRSNLKGALRLISSGVELMRPFSPSCLGIDVEHFLHSTGRMEVELERTSSGEFLLPVIPKIKRTSQIMR